MMDSVTDNLPAYKDWSLAAVRLLQGAVYSDDAAWDLVLRHESALKDYFARIGLLLIVDEPEGLSFIRQLSEDEATDEYASLPRLFRRTRLGYESTLLCILLREHLRRFEEEDLDSHRCVVDQAELLESWKTFFPSSEDEVRLQKTLETAFRKLEGLKFVNRFGETPGCWEVRRILKARLPVDELEKLKQQILNQAQNQ
ncbi:MAG: DUF4194 domain-containing protein [bacterium]|nr:DUF4194 domain-containing protein [bacterium]